MFAELKPKILKLLEEDEEFRYAVAGLLGISEILKRLDAIAEEQARLREEQVKIWEELKRLREDMIKGFQRHDEILEKHSQEIARLREDMIKGFQRHDEEMAKLREDMNRGFQRHDEELARLRRDYNMMLEAIRRLQEGHIRLERAMITGFGELSRFAGVSFEEFVRRFLTANLRRAGEIPEDAELRRAVVEGEEINLFLEEPLIVGEVTGYADSIDEVRKLLRKAEKAKARYCREPRKFLIILSIKREVLRELERMAEEKGVELIVGRPTD